jgi:hypothetical protein
LAGGVVAQHPPRVRAGFVAAHADALQDPDGGAEPVDGIAPLEGTGDDSVGRRHAVAGGAVQRDGLPLARHADDVSPRQVAAGEGDRHRRIIARVPAADTTKPARQAGRASNELRVGRGPT